MGVNFITTLKSVLLLIRPLNLFLICLSLLLIRYTLVIPILQWNNFSSGISDTAYFLLILSIVFIAAGGYIINDIFDIGIDGVNKPDKNPVGKTLSKRQATLIYVFITSIGLILSFISGYLADKNYMIFINFLCAGLLYFYSASYKKMFLVGNIIISLLSSVSVYSAILYDHHALLSEPIITLVSAYALFAFVISMIREIIKDCEDAGGDQLFGSTTLPIVIGIKPARIIAFFITVLVFASVLYIQVTQKQWENKVAFSYVIFCVQLPLTFLAIKIISSRKQSDDHFASNLTKIIMLTGIMSIPVFYFTSV